MTEPYWEPLAAVVNTEIEYIAATVPIGVTATTEAASNTLISASARVYDGVTPIWLEFESPRIDFGSQALALILFDGSTAIGRVDFGNNSNIGYTMALYYKTRLTPSAGSHTYSWRGFLVAGTGTITVRFGTGGAGSFLPGFMRVSYA